MKKLLICLTSIILSSLVFMDSSFAKVRSYTFEYTVTNRNGAPLKAQKEDYNSRITSTVHFSPSDIVAPGQTMKITGTMDVDGPIVKDAFFSPTISTITFSIVGTQKTVLIVLLKPTYLRGVLSPILGSGICSGYYFVTTRTSVDIIHDPTRYGCTADWGL